MKRHRVRLRPKARRRRRLAALLLLLAAGAVPLRDFARRVSLPRLPGVAIGPLLPSAAAVEKIEFTGAPPDLEDRLRASIRWKPGDRWGLGRSYRIGRELRDDFPCLESVSARRSWTGHSVRFDIVLRAPMARVADAGYLDKSGRVFPAPEGVFDGRDLPEVRLAPGLPAVRETRDFARVLAQLSEPGALPAAPVRLSLGGSSEGLSADLADGTRLLWGDLRWTREKLMRLKEVLADAGPRFGRGLTADLRHFEDGKIFVRPK